MTTHILETQIYRSRSKIEPDRAKGWLVVTERGGSLHDPTDEEGRVLGSMSAPRRCGLCSDERGVATNRGLYRCLRAIETMWSRPISSVTCALGGCWARTLPLSEVVFFPRVDPGTLPLPTIRGAIGGRDG
jgi:hypothetical protein